jgi:hypothetical protein
MKMSENTKRQNRIIVGVVIFGIAVFFAHQIIKATQSNFTGLEERLPSVFYISNEVSNIIEPEYLPLVKVEEIVRTKVRNDFSVLTISNNFQLVIYKINGRINNSLKTAVHTEIKSVDRSTGISYGFLPFTEGSYQFKAGRSNNVSEIYLTLFGKSITELKREDNVVAYSLLNENVSLRYGVDSAIDIYIESSSTIFDKPKPIQIMILKRDSSVYFVTLTAKKKETLPGNTILSMIKH